MWVEAGIGVDPVFIVVCNNTATSKLVHDYIAGYEVVDPDGTVTPMKGKCPLFRNFDPDGAALPQMRTLLIDSLQLESGEAISPEFREAAAPEIARFKDELIQRTGDRAAADRIDDAAILREVMNTVGRKGALGEHIRCVVSVSMLTEGWDANTVTHVLGVRAFGTQLLCEQVIGRALRRQSYLLQADGRFAVEYADVLGIPFDFTAQPVVAPVKPPQNMTRVHAISPARDGSEIRFPRVEGYRTELGQARITADFTPDSTLELTPDIVGATNTVNAGIIAALVGAVQAMSGGADMGKMQGALIGPGVLEKAQAARTWVDYANTLARNDGVKGLHCVLCPEQQVSPTLSLAALLLV